MASPLRPLEKVSGTVLIDTTALLKFSTWSILCETADIGRPKRSDAGGLCGEYEAWGESVARKFALESTLEPHGRPKRALKPQQRYRTPYPAFSCGIGLNLFPHATVFVFFSGTTGARIISTNALASIANGLDPHRFSSSGISCGEVRLFLCEQFARNIVGIMPCNHGTLHPRI